MTGAKASQHPKALKVFRIVIKYVKPYMIPFICDSFALCRYVFSVVCLDPAVFIDTINASDKARLLNLIKTCWRWESERLCLSFSVFHQALLTGNADKGFYTGCFEKLNKVPFSFIQSKHSGDMTSRVTKDVSNIRNCRSIIYDLGYSFLTCLIVFVFI